MHTTRRLAHNLLLALATLTLALLCGSQLTAARAHSPTTFIVTKTADTNDGLCDADCSLREAIVAANAQPGADSVIVPAGIYTLTIPGIDEDAGATGDLDITDDLTLTGAGAEATVVDGGGIDGILDVVEYVTSTFAGVKLTGGYTANNYPTGVGIANKGTVTFTNSSIISNTGTGIRNYLGALTLIGATVAENTVGGISNVGGIITISESIISDNLYGLDNLPAGSNPNYIFGVISIANSVISTNTSSSGVIGGGGVRMQGGVLTITNSIFRGNNALNNALVEGGGVSVIGYSNNAFSTRVTITASIFQNNNPGGLYFYSPGYGDDILTISGSIFSNNTGPSGAGVQVFGPAVTTIRNTTFSQNMATDGIGSSGGGLYVLGWADVADSTFSGNTATGSGGGLYVSDGILRNITVVGNTADSDNGGNGEGGGIATNMNTQFSGSIIAGNILGNGLNSDCSGFFNSAGYNLLQDPTSCVISGTLTGVITGTDPLLGPLQDNGGPTLTHAPLLGSPVIDAGNPATPGSSGACEVIDQRGYVRPVDGDGNSSAVCDIGAVETGSVPGVAFPANAVSVNEAEALATLTATLSATSTATITVEYATSDGTASAGSDYLTATGTLTFAPGSTEMTFTVPMVDDMLDEPDETVTVTLSNPVNALLVGASVSTLTIVDNDIEYRQYLPMLRR